jgi:hypothetical protein
MFGGMHGDAHGVLIEVEAMAADDLAGLIEHGGLLT